MSENRQIAEEIARRVFEELGNPPSLETTQERLAAMLTIAFDNYREYLLALVSLRGAAAMDDQQVTIPPLALDEEPMSKADVDFEKVRWDVKWHALQALCEVTKLGKADPHITKCLHSIASQIANL